MAAARRSAAALLCPLVAASGAAPLDLGALRRAPRVQHVRVERGGRAPPLELDVLRDDAVCLAPGVCGNKARKLAATPLDAPLASYGGAQSNAAAALAALAAHARVPFTYYVRPLPAHLAAAPHGNLGALHARGATVVELGADAYAALRAHAAGEAPRPPFLEPRARLVPQGGAWAAAEPGVATLAAAVDRWAGARARAGERALAIVPAGTGTTALFLARHARAADVLAVPCVGGAAALRAQWRALDAAAPAASGGGAAAPRALDEPRAAVRFGALDARVLRAWRAARRAGLELDLVYGAPAWAQLLARGVAEREWGARRALYVHSGGLEGAASQLRRYARAGMLTREEADALDAGRAGGGAEPGRGRTAAATAPR